LGKHQEGRALFDELLAAEGRKFETLLGVSELLRQVGSVAEARELAEEAYNNQQDPHLQHVAAGVRAQLFVDLEDEIQWLRLADVTSPFTSTSLEQALGQQAFQAGRNDEAAQHLRQAVQGFLRQTENSSSLNNAAGASFYLYRVTGERADFDRGVELMEKAVKLSPSNSILLHNSAVVVLDSALREIIGEALDLKRLQRGAELDHLEFLYHDEAGWRQFVERLKNHADVARALDYLDREMLLAPKTARTYHSAAELRSFTRDAAALADLLRRLEQAQPDTAQLAREAQEFQSGKNDDKYRRQLTALVAQGQSVLDSYGERPRDATYAMAAAMTINSKISLDMLGEPSEPDELVRLAEAARTAAPSLATSKLLFRTLALRAARGVAREDVDFATLLERHRRTLPVEYLLAVALAQPGPSREALLESADLRRLQQLLVEYGQDFPSFGDPWKWAMLRHSHPAEAARLSAAAQADESARQYRAIEFRLFAGSAAHLLYESWALEMAGRETEAQELVRRLLTPEAP
jgi:tetratricopeptide (TPR) repeat protein